MHSTSATASPGFHPAFFSASAQPLPGAATASVDALSSAIRYSPELHGSFEQFRLSEDFQRANAQMRADVGALAAFIDTHEPARGDYVRQQFSTFLDNLDAGAFSDWGELLYCHGLPALHEATRIVSGDHRVDPMQDKVGAVMRLADGMTVCAPGVMTHLTGAARELALGAGGLREMLWKAKEQAVMQMLQHHVSDWYQDRVRQLRDELALYEPGAEAALQRFYANNEIHFVSALWDEMAERLGLPRKNDPLHVAMPFDRGIREEAKSLWLDAIRERLKPSAIAMSVAEEVLRAYGQDVQQAGLPLEGLLHADRTDALADEGRATSERLGLPPSESLNLYNLVAFEGAGYRVRQDASLLAVEILAHMDKLGLISGQPEIEGHWTEQAGGADYTLFVYEALAWKVEGVVDGGQGLDWTNVDRWTAHPLSLQDLRGWSAAAAQAGKCAIVPQGALLHVIAKTPPEECMRDIPASWVTDQASHQALRDRLGLGLAAYGAYVEHRWPAQLTLLIKECQWYRVTLPTVYESYEQQQGVKTLPPLRLVLDCQDRTYADPCREVLKHWPPHEKIDERLKSCLGSTTEFWAFQAARKLYLFTHRRSVPQEWPKAADSTKRKP